MEITTSPEVANTLFITEDNQPVHEIGEDEGEEAFIVGTLVFTNAKLLKHRGQWQLRGTINLRLSDPK